jgi:hypothetical protein
MFGIPKEDVKIKKTGVLVLGQVEQNYGIYQIPAFRDLVTTMWNDSVLREAIQAFAEQVVATGYFLSGNPKYEKKINGKTALDAIIEWCKVNNLEEKLLEISVELKAFGNSFWRISDMGFSKVPIESVWHVVRVSEDVPLQEKYHVQLVPIYTGNILPWGEFIHFRVYVTGYRAPFGVGMLHSLLARPVMMDGTVCPSIYDVRLNQRASLDEGFRKFSFGNVWISMEGLPEDQLAAQADQVATMKSTGNRVLVNVPTKVSLEVPERTQSYDSFIKVMRDEFYMSLGDPTLKLGLEMGFTKATAETAAELYKFKISTMRQTIKHELEKLFVVILDKLGYDGKEACVELNFEKVEAAIYDEKLIKDFILIGMITKNEGRYLISKYGKWDIKGDVEGGDIPLFAPERVIPQKAMPTPSGTVAPPTATPQELAKPEEKVEERQNELKEGIALVVHESGYKGLPVVITELPDRLAGYSKDKIYIDPLTLADGYPKKLILVHETTEQPLVVKMGVPYDKAHLVATDAEHAVADANHINWEDLVKLYQSILYKIKVRGSKGPEDLIRE